MRKLDTEPPSIMPEGLDDEGDNWEFEGMGTAKKVATSGICGKLQEVQRLCENGREAMPTAVVEEIRLAREAIEANRKNATLSNRNTVTEADIVEARAVSSTMHKQLTAAKRQIKV